MVLTLWIAAALIPLSGGRVVADPIADPTKQFYEQLDPSLAAARLVIEASGSDADELENMRERLLSMRALASTAERKADEALKEAKSLLEQLGPAPAEGTDEQPEVAARRDELNRQVAEAQVPLLRAQDALRQINELIQQLDVEVWSRVSLQLRTLGPSPIAPGNWISTYEMLGQRMEDARLSLSGMVNDPDVRAAVTTKLPRNLVLLMIGLLATLLLRSRLIPLVENALGRETSPRRIALLVALRNVFRLAFPAVGAGLLFAALDPALLRGTESIHFFNLPPFVLALIGSTWLASSIFAPKLAAYRVVPLDDAEAARGARLTILLGGILALHLFIINHLGYWEMTPAVNATLNFPMTLLAALGLWRAAALLRVICRNIQDSRDKAPPDQKPSALGVNLLSFLERAVFIISVASPVLSAIGYFALGQGLLYPMILTLGLLGANLVVFDLLQKTVLTMRLSGAVNTTTDVGLGPVIVVAVLAIASAPLLALIWGARPSDLASFWLLLREGGSLGGVRLSAGDVLTLILVFGVCYGLTRAFQSLLAGSVLPRTRLDAGGKNAILSGVGYLGVAIGVVVAISAAGIDLSNVAIVAGALSVGIGFGLQTIVSNFVSGIILLVERPIKQGDWIEVGTFSGYVRRISVRSTEIETFDRASVILPNSDLVSGAVLNRTHSGMSGRIQIPVSVTYDADPRRVSEVLLEIAEGHPLVLEEPAPRVLLMALGPDSMDFEIRCWLRDVNFSLSARSDMNFEVIERLNEAGIRIQFWQRDVRMPPTPPVFGQEDEMVSAAPPKQA